MEKLIQIQDQDAFSNQLRKLIREELSLLLSSIIQAPKEEKLLTRNDVMKIFDISVATLWKRMNDGSIKYFKIGRKVFFKESDVNDALKEV